jgi:CheY-like chemotaxis protein
MLEQLGCVVDVANNGVEALATLEHASFAAVLMDCHMPEMDGFTTSAEIRRREGPGQHIPVIAVTADAMQGDWERCIAAGMDDYLPKPIRADRLEAVLARWIPVGEGTPEDDGSAGAQPPTRTENAAVAPIDATALEMLRESQRPGAPDVVAELVAEFRESAARQLSAMRGAIDRGDATALAEAGHALKGDAAVLGANRVRTMCADLEARGRAGGVGPVDLVNDLEREVTRAITALETACSAT